MRIIKTKNYDEMCEVASLLIASQIIKKDDSVLGLATGSTPIGVYERLVNYYKKGLIDFHNIKTVNLDEYYGLSNENKQSYRYFMNFHLFDKVNININNTYIPDGLNINDLDECKRYEKIINENNIDLQLLGLGHNGHIGFNEPDDKFINATHLVKLSDKTIEANKRFFNNIDDVPKFAYTMGINSIFNSKMIIMIVSGKDKSEIVKNAFFKDISPLIPASILQLHPNFILIGDQDALSKIEV